VTGFLLVGSGGFAVHAAVDETDEVREVVVAEKAGDGAVGQLDAIGLVQTLGIGGQAAGVSKKSDIEGAAEHAFIGAEPLKAFLHSNSERLIGHGAFRWPQAGGLGAEDAFVIFAGAAQLLPCIIRLTKRAARQRRSGIGHARDIRIAEQRQNGVIKRRGADFDLPALRRFAIGGKH